MCERDCKYRCVNDSHGNHTKSCDCLYKGHGSRVAWAYKKLGVNKMTQEVRDWLDQEECPFYEKKDEETKSTGETKSGGGTTDADAMPKESKRRGRPPAVLPEEKLMEAYKRGLNDADIAIEVGIEQDKVTRWRKKQKLESNYTFYRTRTARAVNESLLERLYRSGMGDTEIAVNAKVSMTQVRNWRERNRLRRNTPGSGKKQKNKKEGNAG